MMDPDTVLVQDVLGQTTSMWVRAEMDSKRDPESQDFSPNETARRRRAWHAIQVEIWRLQDEGKFPKTIELS
jgi:hypothetical protein